MGESGVFLGRCPRELRDQFIKAEFELAPDRELGRRENPFLIQVRTDTARPVRLERIPAEHLIYAGDGGVLIDATVEQVFLRSRERPLIEQLEKRQKELDQLTATHDRRQSELDELEEQQSRAEAGAARAGDLLRSVEESLRHADRRIAALTTLGILSEAEVSPLRESRTETHDSPEKMEPSFEKALGGDRSLLVAHVQACLAAEGLLYPRHLLANFTALLRTHDVVFLAGSSGAGKTQLVRSFARAIGAAAHIIPVKPNWTSSEDLLGYYNPLQRTYQRTPFLDAVLAAAKDPERLHLICLDEVNLARVEYYFADFLSALEERNGDPTLALYSATDIGPTVEVHRILDLVAQRAAELPLGSELPICELFGDPSFRTALAAMIGGSGQETLGEVLARLRALLPSATVPTVLVIPPNVRFLGSLNVDDTTFYLSPKVLDRVHVVKFGNPALADWPAVAQEVDGNFPPSPIRLHPSHLADTRDEYPRLNLDDPCIHQLLQWARHYLAPLGVELGLRTMRQAASYRNALVSLYPEAAEQAALLALNNIVLQKVLPRFRFTGDLEISGGSLVADRPETATREEIVAEFGQELAVTFGPLRNTRAIGGVQPPLASDEVDAMIHRAAQHSGIFNYWA